MYQMKWTQNDYKERITNEIYWENKQNPRGETHESCRDLSARGFAEAVQALVIRSGYTVILRIIRIYIFWSLVIYHHLIRPGAI